MKKREMKDILAKNVLEYARYTITDRAIPSLSDGLKNIHRRIIWSMYLDKLTHDRPRTKSVNAVGSVLRFSPHGDASVYDAAVRLANDSVLYQLIDGKGSFSTVTSRDVSAGASRYTEMRLAPITQEILKDIDKNTVDMVNNYDDTRLEPTDLPATFPLILANPNTGIAMGVASNICSFNLNDIIENTINILTGKETFAMLPDFPTGGEVIRDEKVMEEVKKTGKGSFKLRAKYHINGDSIEITEIPYTTTKEAIIESIISLVKENKIKGITNVNDNTGVDGLDITIDIKKNTNVEHLMAQLYKYTPLQSTFSCNFTVLLDNKPVTLGTDDILREWIKFRAKCIKRATKFDLDKKKEQLHNIKGLQRVLLNIDKAIEIIRTTKKNSDVVNNLMKEFNIDADQAEYIADIKLRNLNEEYILNKTESIKTLESEIDNLNNILSDKKRIAKIIIEDLNRVKKLYGKPRKTAVVDQSEIEEIHEKEIEVDDYNVRIFITKEGYLKKIPLTSLRGNFTIKLKDGDEIVNEIETTNNSDILVFTNKKNVYKYKTYDLEDHKPSVLGEYLPTLLNLKDEDILFVTVTNDYKGFLIVGFEDGKVAKIELSAYQTKQNRSMLKNAYADKKALFFKHIDENIDVLALSSIGKALVFNTSMVNPKSSKTTIGVQIMKPKNNSVVDSYYSLDDGEYEETEYYRVANAGIGKYLRSEDFSTKIPLDKRKK